MSRVVSALARAFPAPNYLAMSGAGIDISASSIKAVTLSGRGDVLALNAHHKMDLEEGVVFDGDIEKPDRLAEVLRTLRLRERIHFAHVSLIEKKSYLYQTVIPKGASDMRAAVEFSLEGNVPVPPDEVFFDFQPATVSHST